MTNITVCPDQKPCHDATDHTTAIPDDLNSLPCQPRGEKRRRMYEKSEPEMVLNIPKTASSFFLYLSSQIIPKHDLDILPVKVYVLSCHRIGGSSGSSTH